MLAAWQDRADGPPSNTIVNSGKENWNVDTDGRVEAVRRPWRLRKGNIVERLRKRTEGAGILHEIGGNCGVWSVYVKGPIEKGQNAAKFLPDHQELEQSKSRPLHARADAGLDAH